MEERTGGRGGEHREGGGSANGGVVCRGGGCAATDPGLGIPRSVLTKSAIC